MILDNDEVITEKKPCWVRPTNLNLVNENEYMIDAVSYRFRNHPSLTEIKSKFMFAQSFPEFSPNYTNPWHVAFLLNSFGIKKASGVDKILPILEKLASNTLSVPVPQAINNNVVAVKRVMVSLITKKLMMKTKFLNTGL